MAKDPDKPRCTGRTAEGKPCKAAPLDGTTRCHHHSYKVPGRPRKITPEVTERVVDAILEGAYIETAAGVVGIAKSTLYRWLRKGEELEAIAAEHAVENELGEEADVYELTDPSDWGYLDFRHAVKSAEYYAELELLRLTKRVAIAGGAWQAFITVLERRHPDRWGRRKVIDHTFAGELETRTKVELVVPSEEERRAAILAILERSGALTDE